MFSERSGGPSPAPAGVGRVRWWARVLGLLASGFFVAMFVGESLHAPVQRSFVDAARDIGAAGVIGLVLFGLYAAGMLLAWRWERTGVTLSAVALGLFFATLFFGLFRGNVEGGFSTRGVFNPVLLAFWIPLVLFAWSRRMR